MGTNYLELPYDALVKITDRLSKSELLKLRRVNQRSKRIIEALPVWQDYIEQQWLRYDDQDIGNDIARNFKYFINRSMKDSYTTRKLKQIQSGTLSYKEVFETVWSLSDNFGVELSPVLNKVITNLNKANNVCTVSYAKIILQTTRHKVAYKVLDITAMQKPMSPISKVLGPVEHLYFIVSHLDPSFDKLLPYRRKVSTQVKDKLRFDKTFVRSNPTQQIIAINRAFVQTVQQNGGNPKFSAITSEDGSIMRVYAGETLGLPLMRLAIIQKIAFELNIHCEILQCPMDYDPKNISTGVMRVFDPKYPKNASYISLYPDFRSKKSLELRVQTTYELSEELHNSKLVGRQKSAARFLKEFANKMLVAAFLSDMVEVKSKWDRNDLSQDPSTIFPISQECLPHNNIILASGYFVLIQSHAKMASKRPGQNVLKYLKTCDNHSNFVPIILKMYPWDLGVLNPKYISRAIPIEDLKTHTIKEFFNLKKSLELVPDDINKRLDRMRTQTKDPDSLPNYFPGQIIEIEGLYYVVIGYIRSATNGKDQYSMIDVRRGMVGIGYETLEFRSVDPYHIDIDLIANQSLIGAYFERYDPAIQRFVPGKAIREVYPGLEKLRDIESASETVAREDSMMAHPELEPLVFNQINTVDLYEPSMSAKLRNASSYGKRKNGSTYKTNGKLDSNNLNKELIMGTPEDFKKHVEKIVEEKFEEAIANECDIETILSRDINEMLNGDGITDLMSAVGLDESDIGKLMNIPTSQLSEIAVQQSLKARNIMNESQKPKRSVNNNTSNGIPKPQQNSQQKLQQKPKISTQANNNAGKNGNTVPKDFGNLKSAQNSGFPGFMFGPFRPNGSLVTSDDEHEDPHAHCNHDFVEEECYSEAENSDEELVDPNDPRFQMVAAAFKELQNASARGPAEFTSTLNALFGDGSNRSSSRVS